MTAKVPVRQALEAPVRSDQIYSYLLRFSAGASVALLGTLILLLVAYSSESITTFGLGFLTSSDWDPVAGSFGAFPFIFGTVITSVIALVLAFIPAVCAAMFVVIYAPKWLGAIVAFVVELLAAIPSVVFGIWGIFVLVPLMRTTIDPILQNTLGKLPVIGSLFPAGYGIGQNLLTAGTILAIMILPTIMSVSRAVIAQAPRDEINDMRALGATRWQVVSQIVLPNSRKGILAGAMLGLARALGETMAVTMVIGNSFQNVSPSLLVPGYTLASGIANQFTEADTSLYFSAIVELGLVLLLVDSAISLAANAIKRRSERHEQAKH